MFLMISLVSPVTYRDSVINYGCWYPDSRVNNPQPLSTLTLPKIRLVLFRYNITQIALLM